MAAATAILCLLPLASSACSDSPPVRPPSEQASSGGVIAPERAGQWVDRTMELFRQYAYDSARASGGAFPQYNRWLDQLSFVIETGGSAPGAEELLVIQAEAEPDPFRRPLPETRDLELIGAIQQYSHLASLGTILVRGFSDESRATRAAAAQHLRMHYRLEGADRLPEAR